MVALSHQAKLKNRPFSIQPEAAITEVTKTDLIIIPAVHGNIKEVLSVNKALLPWIVQQ